MQLSSVEVQYSEISPSEFFYRNRDLAGFSNPARALYSSIRELVENSLDSCESISALPKIDVSLKPVDAEDSDPRLYHLSVEDNGTGVAADRIPLAFGRVFYGSKFTLKQARGMFGLGGTMSILYGQITTNKPVRIVSSTDGETMYDCTMMIDIQQNSPIVLNTVEKQARGRRGTKVEIIIQGDYFRAIQKIQEYFRQTALVNPYAQIKYVDPKGVSIEFSRATKEMPPSPKETKPHPHGVDVETIRRLVRPNKNRLIELSQEVLNNRIENGLGMSIKRVVNSSKYVTKYLAENDFSGQGKKQKIWRVEDVFKGIDVGTDTHQRKYDEIKVLDEVVSKWDNLPRPVKSFLSVIYQIPIDSRRALAIKMDSIDLVRQRLRPSDKNNVGDGLKISPIQPFFDHLLSVSGGETLAKFMMNFHRVGRNNANNFLTFARLDPNRRVRTLSNEELVSFVSSLHRFEDFLMPDVSCLSPLNEEILTAGIQKELEPEFIAVIQRPPSAYSGFPFRAEVGLAYGGKILSKGLKLLRFANRIPLLYDEGSDVSWKILNEDVDWKRYRIPQDAPLAIITHVCSTKIPYKTVGKEYLADRPELERELKNGIREVLRKLTLYLSKKGSMEMVKRKMNIYGKYLPLVAKFSTSLSGSSRLPRYNALLRTGKELDVKKNNVREDEKLRGVEIDAQKTLEEYD